MTIGALFAFVQDQFQWICSAFETPERQRTALRGWFEDRQASLCGKSGAPRPTAAGNAVSEEIGLYPVKVGFAAVGGGATRP